MREKRFPIDEGQAKNKGNVLAPDATGALKQRVTIF